MIKLKSLVKSAVPHCAVIFCEMPLRTDKLHANETRVAVNGMIGKISDFPCVSNSNIEERNLCHRGYHLKPSGSKLLAMNVIRYLRENF